MRRSVGIAGIRGHAVARRALEVAWTGGHDILLWGPRGAGKTTLIEAYSAASEHTITMREMDSCACGNFSSITAECTCNVRMLERWQRRARRILHEVDMALEVVPPTTRELMADPTPNWYTDLIPGRVDAARAFGLQHTDLRLDDTGIRTMEMVMRRLSLTAGEHDSVMRVSRTIANMSQASAIQARHVAEAVQYRAVQFRMAEYRRRE